MKYKASLFIRKGLVTTLFKSFEGDTECTEYAFSVKDLNVFKDDAEFLFEIELIKEEETK